MRVLPKYPKIAAKSTCFTCKPRVSNAMRLQGARLSAEGLCASSHWTVVRFSAEFRSWNSSHRRAARGGNSTLREQAASVYALGFLLARSLHDVVPNLGRGAVLAADRVAVDGGGGGHRRMARRSLTVARRRAVGSAGPIVGGKSHDSACMRHALAIRSFRRRTEDRLPV